MSDVRSLTPDRALREGPALRLNRLDQPWERALRLAIAILSEREPIAAESGPRDVTSVELSVPTDKLWERVVHEALKRAGFAEVLDQRAQPSGMTEDPWVRMPKGYSRTAPDNIAVSSTEVFVVDAKYKTPRGNAPSRDDQYQMFAYSHLVRDQGRDVRAAVLVYPGKSPTQSWFRGRDDSDRPVELFAVQIPFPMPEDLDTASTWVAYLDRAGRVLAQELQLVSSNALGATA